MSLLYPSGGTYSVTITFMDGVSVPVDNLEVDDATKLFHQYIADAKLHDSDGAAYTAKRIILSGEVGKFGTDEILDMWERDEDVDGLPARFIAYNESETIV
jgi:hypothetical protein